MLIDFRVNFENELNQNSQIRTEVLEVFVKNFEVAGCEDALRELIVLVGLAETDPVNAVVPIKWRKFVKNLLEL